MADPSTYPTDPSTDSTYLKEAFGTTDEKSICLEILLRGDLQVSDKERKQEYDNLFKDVASVLAEKCVNPESNRPYTMTMLERALRDVHFNVDPKKGAKQQALEALPVLQAQFPIERAKMSIKLSGPMDKRDQLLAIVESFEGIVSSQIEEANAETCSALVQIEPSTYRDLHNRVQSELGGRGRLVVLDMAVVAEGLQADEFSNLQGERQAREKEAASSARPGDAQLEPPVATPTTTRRSVADMPSGSGVRKEVGAGESQPPIYRGSIQGLPEAHASRRERFAELDTLQAGWLVELRNKGDTVEAVFFSPSGDRVGAFTSARRQALASSKGR